MPKDSAGGKEKKRRGAKPAPPGGKKVRVKIGELKGAGAALLAGAGAGAGAGSNKGVSIIPLVAESFAWEPNVTGDCRPKDVLVPFTYTTVGRCSLTPGWSQVDPRMTPD